MSTAGPPQDARASGGEAAGPKGASASEGGGRHHDATMNGNGAQAAKSAPVGWVGGRT